MATTLHKGHYTAPGQAQVTLLLICECRMHMHMKCLDVYFMSQTIHNQMGDSNIAIKSIFCFGMCQRNSETNRKS